MTKGTKNNLLVSACVAGLMLCAWLVAIFWAENGYQKKADILEQVARVGSEQKYSSSLSGLVEGTAADRATLSSFFLTVDKQADMMDKLDQIARNQGLVFDLRNAAEEGTEVKFDIQVEGSFSQVASYLVKLDNWPYYSKLAGVKLERNGSRWIGQAVLEVHRLATQP